MSSRETRTEHCGQQLVNAQVSVNRAVFELNRRETGSRPGRGPAPRDEHTLHCVLQAMEELAKAAAFLQGQRGQKR
jgi:hypothetical protein